MMDEYAVMPLADYKNACDAIRSQTGDTNLIKSGKLADEINRITAAKEFVEVTVRNNTAEKWELRYAAPSGYIMESSVNSTVRVKLPIGEMFSLYLLCSSKVTSVSPASRNVRVARSNLGINGVYSFVLSCLVTGEGAELNIR